MQTTYTSEKAALPGTGARNVGAKIKTICFDVDGTLRDYQDRPRNEVVEVLKLYVRAGWRVCVWSGGGRDYAASVGRLLKLPESVEYYSKIGWHGERPDIAVDDQNVSLGKRNVRV